MIPNVPEAMLTGIERIINCLKVVMPQFELDGTRKCVDSQTRCQIKGTR